MADGLIPGSTPALAPASVPSYAELHCLSNFSFQRGASRPEELVARAHALGYTALAITDECSVELRMLRMSAAIAWRVSFRRIWR